MRRNDTGRRHAASAEVRIVSEVVLRTNDFGLLLSVETITMTDLDSNMNAKKHACMVTNNTQCLDMSEGKGPSTKQ